MKDVRWGTSSRKLTGPAIDAADLPLVDAVLLTHDHHAGVCIHELAAIIQVEDRIVPIETITVAANIVPRLTRPSP